MSFDREQARPILVTGGHRSGTGWVGQVLATSTQPIGYIWEPFSLRHRPGTLAVRWPYWFPYVTEENGAQYREPIERTLGWHYAASAELGSLRSAKDAGRMTRDWWRFARHRRRRAVPLFKDPIAVFSVEWLVREFDMRVVMIVRHPAAFVSSLKRLHWTHPFTHFTEQPLLMRDLEPYADQLRDFARTEHGIVDQGILLWNVIHYFIAGYVDRHREWLVVRQEDLAYHPGPQFRHVFESLRLPYGPQTEAMIEATTSSSNAPEAKPGSIYLDSAAHAKGWKRGLDSEEIARIRRGTEGLADRFYDEGDW
jgi:hypothetical protein